jgi:hypothetical protein
MLRTPADLGVLCAQVQGVQKKSPDVRRVNFIFRIFAAQSIV